MVTCDNVIEKTIIIFRKQKTLNLKLGLLRFLSFFKNLKNLGFFKSDFYSPGVESTATYEKTLSDRRTETKP